MKAFKYLSCLLICGILIVFAAGNLSVFGEWIYSHAASQHIDMSIEVQVVPWEGYEQLPSTQIGENHVALIKRLIESSYGINDPDSFLNDYIQDRINDSKDNAASVAPTPKGNLKDLFSTSEMARLDFMIHIHFDDKGQVVEYEIFTFETALVGSTAGKTVYPVYRSVTTLDENGKWVVIETTCGSATTMKYDAKQGGGKNITVDPFSYVREVK